VTEAYEIVDHTCDVVIAGAGGKRIAQRTCAAADRTGHAILRT
jgi:hypothetical protein